VDNPRTNADYDNKPDEREEIGMSKSNRPNIGADLARLHSIITRGLDVAIEHSQSFAQHGYPDASTREGFINYVRSLASVLHAHHLTEDDVAFPYFRDLMPDTPFDSLTAEHQEMKPLLEEIDVAIGKVEAGAQTAESLNDLNHALTQVRDLWHPHIELEGAHLSPEKADELLGVEEQIELGKRFAQHNREHAKPDHLVVPFLLYNLPPEERAIFSQGMPPVVTQELVPVVWKEKWSPMKPFLLD
jgi:hemerythrin-like domain-containing protein